MCFLWLLQGCNGDLPHRARHRAGAFWPARYRPNDFTALALHDGRLYGSGLETNDSNFFYCLNARTGLVEWTVPVASWANQAPVVTDSFIYYASYLGDLYKMDKAGRILWSVKLEGSFSGHALDPATRNLFVTTVQSGVYEFDAANGSVRRRYGRGSLGMALPVFSDGRMYLGGINKESGSLTKGNWLCCFDPRTGDTLWQYDRNTNPPRLLAYGDKLYVAGEDNRLLCLRARDGADVWITPPLTTPGKVFPPIFPSLLPMGRFVFYFDSNPAFAIDTADGSIRDTRPLEEFVRQRKILPPVQTFLISHEGRQYRVRCTANVRTYFYYGTEYDITVE